MFASPAMRLQNQENLNSLEARKACLTNPRKAFQDCAVNEKFRQEKSSAKPKLNIFSEVTTRTEHNVPDNEYDDCYIDICSRECIEDTYQDILLGCERLSKKDITNFIYAFINIPDYEPAPPLPEFIPPQPIDIKLPAHDDMGDFLNYFKMETVDDLPLPNITFNDFDF